ncbi:histone deacetylase family protein [Qingshengfaniella alkalisoli]|uniref:Histone deacetylase family protein n=1 Tax=Qingshengfaniella alkalisoli TaxID=2599296 RepID=A0A5B8J9S4_9RHOB|nr:histone deacetylase family protein [Qingshengfaniella alkalisoli]QDY71057.1 histone deacetylase family protein [Qingshengfaniella alkalisoli]
MKAIFDDRQYVHDPKHFMRNGDRLENPEQPERADRLKAGAIAAGCDIVVPSDNGLGPIAAIHTSEYLGFLRTIHGRWTAVDGAGPEVIPNIHPPARTASYPSSPAGLAGYHQADTSCPISEGTWESAYWSAQTAITGADVVLAGGRSAYALCRPPGHHAFSDMAGGFCFLSNAAIAAQRFVAAGLRPAILDVDVHHGNGTQGVFYNRADVLTVSIHADPSGFYPFFWGYAAERGDGAGLGSNLNLPLPRGTREPEYQESLAVAFERIRDFGADVLVLALGLDTHVNDPFEGFAISTEGLGDITAAVAKVGLPTLLVQEGGYLSDDLGPNLTAALQGFLGV